MDKGKLSNVPEYVRIAVWNELDMFEKCKGDK